MFKIFSFLGIMQALVFSYPSFATYVDSEIIYYSFSARFIVRNIFVNINVYEELATYSTLPPIENKVSLPFGMGNAKEHPSNFKYINTNDVYQQQISSCNGVKFLYTNNLHDCIGISVWDGTISALCHLSRGHLINKNNIDQFKTFIQSLKTSNLSDAVVNIVSSFHTLHMNEVITLLQQEGFNNINIDVPEVFMEYKEIESGKWSIESKNRLIQSHTQDVITNSGGLETNIYYKETIDKEAPHCAAMALNILNGEVSVKRY